MQWESNSHSGPARSPPCVGGRAPSLGTFRAHIAALEEQHDLLHPDAQETLGEISLALRGGWLRRSQALRLPGFYRQTFAETQLFRIWFLMG